MLKLIIMNVCLSALENTGVKTAMYYIINNHRILHRPKNKYVWVFC